MGDLTKTEVRRIAEERGFMKAAHKKDSIGVCFCPMDYRTFLRQELPVDAIRRGKFYDEKGDFIAWHEGYPFYTIGQRRGLGIDLNEPGAKDYWRYAEYRANGARSPALRRRQYQR